MVGHESPVLGDKIPALHRPDRAHRVYGSLSITLLFVLLTTSNVRAVRTHENLDGQRCLFNLQVTTALLYCGIILAQGEQES